MPTFLIDCCRAGFTTLMDILKFGPLQLTLHHPGFSLPPIGEVAQLQGTSGAPEHGIKCGQHFVLTHSLFPFVPVVAP